MFKASINKINNNKQNKFIFGRKHKFIRKQIRTDISLSIENRFVSQIY